MLQMTWIYFLWSSSQCYVYYFVALMLESYIRWKWMKISHHAVRILYDCYVVMLFCLCLSAGNRILCSVLPLLRALTEIEICTNKERYRDSLTSEEPYDSLLQVRRISTWHNPPKNNMIKKYCWVTLICSLLWPCSRFRYLHAFCQFVISMESY
jgi:hypothetical protein